MKKTLLVLLLLLGTFGLYGCEKEEEEIIDDEIVFDIPDEIYYNPQTLPYAQYLNLENPVVTIVVRDMGEIKIQLFPDVAPNTVNNFIRNIQSGAYVNNEFHRVVTGFMIQGGYIASTSCTIPGEMTNNGFENLLSHELGVLSMARAGGDYDSQSSQFFIMHAVNTSLDGEYASFGGVVLGFNILEFIGNLEIDSTELPSVTVFIESITVDLKGISYPNPTCNE